ncbi:MAG: hypothetical protein P8R31_15115 [Mariniblastus sp.]|nr:hypothetical protein [Mariniblastus sp.]
MLIFLACIHIHTGRRTAAHITIMLSSVVITITEQTAVIATTLHRPPKHRLSP